MTMTATRSALAEPTEPVGRAWVLCAAVLGSFLVRRIVGVP